MANIRSKNTGPEKIVFAELKKRKIYFYPHPDKIFGRPDLIFRRVKVAVFIDSDFWHGHPDRMTMPQSNRAYWREKIERNRARDMLVNRELRKQGWKVVRIWEYDVKHNLGKVLSKIQTTVTAAKATRENRPK
jgi:DNA mismatch endonuclease (patch repair protein)